MLSPAKINLSLRIHGRRPDGFHEIDTVMVKLPGLADEITITPAEKFSFTCSDRTLPTDSSNLVVKAAEALAKESSEEIPFRIHLKKRIPHGAGLGGGSSNAATTLLALNSQLAKPLPPETLHNIAAVLGSDIPFFLYAGAARCTGRGEIITAAPSPPPLPVVLFKPMFSVPTADAYRNCLDSEPLPGIDHEVHTYYSTHFVNDLEIPVFAKHRYLAELKVWLLNRKNTKAVFMSGSGSTMVAVLDARGKPHNIINAARKHFDKNLWIWSGTL